MTYQSFFILDKYTQNEIVIDADYTPAQPQNDGDRWTPETYSDEEFNIYWIIEPKPLSKDLKTELKNLVYDSITGRPVEESENFWVFEVE